MLDEILRSPKEKVLEPIALSLREVHPMTVTVTAGLVGIGAGAAASQNANGLALGLWAANRLLDGLDGTMARIHKRQSDLGGYLDIVLDMVAYAAIPLGLAFGNSSLGAFMALSFLFGSFYINSATWMYLAALLEKRNAGAKSRKELTSITMPRGLIEGTETIFFYLLFLIFPQWLIPLFWFMGVLVLITAAQRVYWAFRTIY